MSYARFSENSDVYVYDDVHGYVCCCGCLLGDDWELNSVDEIIAHMQSHVAAGHKVPADLLDPETFEDCRFIAMCDIFMCREDIGHEGDHTPLSGRTAEHGVEIRARQIAGVK